MMNKILSIAATSAIILLSSGCAPKKPYTDSELSFLLDMKNRLEKIDANLESSQKKLSDLEGVISLLDKKLQKHENELRSLSVEVSKLSGIGASEGDLYKKLSFKANPQNKTLSFEKAVLKLTNNAQIFNKNGEPIDFWYAGRTFDTTFRIGKYFKIDNYYLIDTWVEAKEELFISEEAVFREAL